MFVAEVLLVGMDVLVEVGELEEVRDGCELREGVLEAEEVLDEVVDGVKVEVEELVLVGRGETEFVTVPELVLE